MGKTHYDMILFVKHGTASRHDYQMLIFCIDMKILWLTILNHKCIHGTLVTFCHMTAFLFHKSKQNTKELKKKNKISQMYSTNRIWQREGKYSFKDK